VSSLFSGRLPWSTSTGLNRLAAAEQARRAAGQPVLDLTVGNPTVVGLGVSVETLADALTTGLADPAAVRYVPAPLGPPAARAAVAREYTRLGATADPSHIVLSASSSESYAWLFKLLANPGDAVLVPEPSYPLFGYLAGLEAITLRPYHLRFAGGEWQLDWSSVNLDGARAIIVVNPNNPTGTWLRRADWERLAQQAADRDIALIVDEVFADYALAPPPDAVRTVAAAGSAPALTFSLGGLSKSCGLPQMKLGWLSVLGPAAQVAEALSRLELIADTYLSVGVPVLAALPRLLAIGSDVRGAIQARLRQNLDQLAAAVRGTSASLLPVEGGWSAILRLPATRSDEDWALALLAEDGVLVQPGYFFDLGAVGATIVISLLTPPELLREGIQRLVARPE
jgi:aspartate/methionine/tyrosine aminotransferase